jgi:hypothetical protein
VDAVHYVTSRIVARYGHPARAAHLYLFRIVPGSDIALLPPDPQSVMMAWVDEGDGLTPVVPGEAVARCQKARAALENYKTNRPLTQRLMARIVVFSVEEHKSASQVIVELFSRALAFTPKGDRRVTETWRPNADGTDGWYSAHPDQDASRLG